MAENSLHLRHGGSIRGDVAVLTKASGPVLSQGAEAVIDVDGRLFGHLRADSLRLKVGATIAGNVGYNDLTQHSQAHVVGSLDSPLALPLDVSLPAFPSFSAGGADVIVPGKSEHTLSAGSYGDVRLNAGKAHSPTVLTLDGGVFAFESLKLRKHSRLECSRPCELRINGRVRAHRDAYIGPAPDSATLVGSVQLYVAGGNGQSGTIDGSPKSVRIDRDCTIRARIFAPNGTLWLRQGTAATGTFIARDVRLGVGVDVRKDEREIVRVRKRALDLTPALLADLGDQL